jgi:DNA-binding LacI/PurR family transcriptional regulator
MTESRSRPARLEDVARESGVHLSTVSRVLNGSDSLTVRPETRDRIFKTAQRLKYRPNAMARGLKMASTGALGLLVPSLRNPVYSAIIRGAFDRAWEEGLVVLLAEDTGGSSAQQAYELLVGEGRIDGLLIASARPGNPILERFAEKLVPCVFVNRRHLGSGCNVYMHEEAAGRIAAEHLLGLGHRRLGHVAGPLSLDTAQRRMQGFVQAVEAAGGDPPLVEEAGFDERGGFDAMTALLRRRRRPSAVFISNINQAVGAFTAARQLGRSVPGDVSMVGYDDDALADYLDVPLTTIRMPLWELGAVAVNALIDQLGGKGARDIVVETPPELVVRSSTAPPAAPARAT